MITITLQWPNQRTKEVLLASIPAIGDHIELSNGGDPGTLETLIVEMVTYVEGSGRAPDPGVIVSVRPYKSGSR